MLKNIDTAKFKSACVTVRARYASDGIPSYLTDIFMFYRYNLADFRKTYRLDKIAASSAALAAKNSPRTLKDFEEEVHAAILNTLETVRATKAQVRQIISLARDLEDYTSIGSYTLNRAAAAQIINGMLAEIEKIDC